MIKLGVNIDHVATVRQARQGMEPDPVAAAVIAEAAGADGITIHLREDRRHIQERDAKILRQTVHTRLNLEMAAAEEIIEIALSLKPDMSTLVPERRAEVTTEGGLDVHANRDVIKNAVKRLTKAGIVVSLFIDAEKKQVLAAKECGAHFVEFHTGPYADAKKDYVREIERAKLYEMADLAVGNGIRVNAGHGLNYWNVQELVFMPGLEEFNIGHSIISRSIITGLARAVTDMKSAIRESYSACRQSPSLVSQIMNERKKLK